MEEKIVFSIAEKILSLKPNGTTVVLYEFSDNTAASFIDFFLPCLLGIKSWNDMSVQLSIGGFLGDLSQYDTNLFSDSPKSVPGLSNPKDILSLFTLYLRLPRENEGQKTLCRKIDAVFEQFCECDKNNITILWEVFLQSNNLKNTSIKKPDTYSILKKQITRHCGGEPLNTPPPPDINNMPPPEINNEYNDVFTFLERYLLIIVVIVGVFIREVLLPRGVLYSLMCLITIAATLIIICEISNKQKQEEKEIPSPVPVFLFLFYWVCLYWLSSAPFWKIILIVFLPLAILCMIGYICNDLSIIPADLIKMTNLHKAVKSTKPFSVLFSISVLLVVTSFYIGGTSSYKKMSRNFRPVIPDQSPQRIPETLKKQPPGVPEKTRPIVIKTLDFQTEEERDDPKLLTIGQAPVPKSDKIVSRPTETRHSTKQQSLQKKIQMNTDSVMLEIKTLSADTVSSESVPKRNTLNKQEHSKSTSIQKLKINIYSPEESNDL